MLEYHGKMEKLKTQIEENRNELQEVLKYLLGRDNYDTLSYFSRSLLIPEAFIDPREEKKLKKEAECYIDVAAERDNKFFISADHEDLDNFSICNNGELDWKNSSILKTCPLFLMGEDGVKIYAKSTLKGIDIPHELASFMHEYTHFTNYALQKMPMQVVAALPLNEMNKSGYSSNMKSIKRMIKNEKQKGLLSKPLGLLSTYLSLIQTEESNTDAILGLVWKKFGEPRLIERFYERYQSKDLFADFDKKVKALEEVGIKKLLNWHTYSSPLNPFHNNFFKSLSFNLKVKKLSANEYFKPLKTPQS